MEQRRDTQTKQEMATHAERRRGKGREKWGTSVQRTDGEETRGTETECV